MKRLYETLLKHPLTVSIKVKDQIQIKDRAAFSCYAGWAVHRFETSDFAGLQLKSCQQISAILGLNDVRAKSVLTGNEDLRTMRQYFS